MDGRRYIREATWVQVGRALNGSVQMCTHIDKTNDSDRQSERYGLATQAMLMTQLTMSTSNASACGFPDTGSRGQVDASVSDAGSAAGAAPPP